MLWLFQPSFQSNWGTDNIIFGSLKIRKNCKSTTFSKNSQSNFSGLLNKNIVIPHHTVLPYFQMLNEDDASDFFKKDKKHSYKVLCYQKSEFVPSKLNIFFKRNSKSIHFSVLCTCSPFSRFQETSSKSKKN